MGAWIEIPFMLAKPPPQPSLLSWERGLKLIEAHYKFESFMVAPLVGAWIEIIYGISVRIWGVVAPLVGAWIEMYSLPSNSKCLICRSSRGSVD